MVTRVVFPLLLIIGAVVGIGFVYPTLNGPFSESCGELVPDVCEQIWREAAQTEDEPLRYLPVTRVRVNATVDDPLDCYSVYIERWIFSTTITTDCF